jgi:hypothetical protein
MIRMMAHRPGDEGAETPEVSTGAHGQLVRSTRHRPAPRERGRPSLAQRLAAMPDVGTDADFERIQLSDADRLTFD